MATYNAMDLLTKAVPGIDQAIALTGSLDNSTTGNNATTLSGDQLRPVKIPAGVRVSLLIVSVTTAFGATAPASIGVSHTDGSTVPASVYTLPRGTLAAATVIQPITDATLATTGNKVVVPVNGPFITAKESYLEFLFGTVVTGAKGVADITVLGEFVGSR
jgi:hypothetical protein